MIPMNMDISDLKFEVTTSDDGGHSPEAIAKMCVDRLIAVGDNAHPAIREQAHAYRNAMLKTVEQYIKMAMQENRATMCAQIRKAGFPELADQLRGI